MGLTNWDNSPSVVKPNGTAYNFANKKTKKKKVPLMLTAEYSRPIPASPGMRVLVNDTWTPSNKDERTFDGKKFTGTSECISYDRHGNATIFSRTRKPNREPKRYSDAWADKENKRRSTVTAANMPAIGNVE